MTIQTHAEDRRTMVQKISEHLQVEARYQGPPTFSYAIGPVTVERDSSISSEDAEVLETLKPFLMDNGFIEPEVDALAISVPTEGMDGNQLRNLIYTLYGYQHLLNRVTRRESFSISEAVTTRLGEYLPDTLTDFETLMGDFKALDDLTGVDFKGGAVIVSFPLDEAPEKNKAYADLASAMVRAAREVKRVNAELRRPENEKYMLRSWLLRLGFGGADFKASRNALLNGLKGHTAFRNDAEATKHKEKYAEIRKIARETRDGEVQ
ncbi:MAG: hypothetical protein VB067_07585 [Christensenellaceae bacterium]|nr:hypothetical protein [Christensenellaceae bacterium]MEA5068830.1 hypothetical protein [Christensenellaceae bacterium]